MSNPPRIWLDYRPVRIGWVAEARDVAQLATAASWSTCLWGGLFNPIIPIEDRDFSDKLIRAFGVDVLIPVAASNATTAFVDAYPHLRLRMWRGGVFKDRRSEVSIFATPSGGWRAREHRWTSQRSSVPSGFRTTRCP